MKDCNSYKLLRVFETHFYFIPTLKLHFKMVLQHQCFMILVGDINRNINHDSCYSNEVTTEHFNIISLIRERKAYVKFDCYI